MRCDYCDYTAHIVKGDIRVCLLCTIKWAKKFGDFIPKQQLLFLKDK